MFETSGSWLSQQHYPLESLQHSAFKPSGIKGCMISPVNIRQHEVLPVSVNPGWGLNEFGIPGWPEKGLANEGINLIGNSIVHSTHALPNQLPLEQSPPLPLVYEPPCREQRKFLVFDHSGNETRLMFSSVAPNLCPFWNPQVASAKQLDIAKFLSIGQAGNDEHMCAKTHGTCEESGENEILDEECEMREDTDEINALLYSDDDEQDNDYDDEDEDDDVASSGRSPLAKEEQKQVSLDDEVAISSMSLKRRKTLDGEHENLEIVEAMTTEEHKLASVLDEGSSYTLGSKRPRNVNKIHDTLKVLEGLLPGLNNKDPVVILDEAISYLKSLKRNAASLSLEESDGSGCYETST